MFPTCNMQSSSMLQKAMESSPSRHTNLHKAALAAIEPNAVGIRVAWMDSSDKKSFIDAEFSQTIKMINQDISKIIKCLESYQYNIIVFPKANSIGAAPGFLNLQFRYLYIMFLMHNLKPNNPNIPK